VRVGHADSETIQLHGFNERSYFAGLCYAYMWQQVKPCQRAAAVLQRSKRKLRRDEGMDDNLAKMEMLAHLFDSVAEMVNPNGGVRKNQLALGLRRGMRLSLGIVPPRAANLRALSRSIKALRASRISVAFSDTPVNSCAVRRRSSSRATVVLIGTYYSID
jgi:hypothetical protein